MEKRVYYRTFIVVFFGIIFAVLSLKQLEEKCFSWDLGGVVFFGFLFLLVLFHSVFPIWNYDEHGFEKNIFLMRKRKYLWADICEIRMVSSDIVWFITKSNARTTLGKLFNRDYKNHLLNVTDYILINNPGVKMDLGSRSKCNT